MQITAAHQRLDQFRQEVYRSVLGYRKDSLCELLDAVLTSADRLPLVRLSLACAFRRHWPSAPDALAAGRVAVAALHTLLPAQLPDADPGERPVWAVDGTLWPRPAAKTSPERTYGRKPVAARPDAVLVPSWEYQWLVALPTPAGRWVVPLDLRRRGPGAPPPTDLALQQLAAVLPAVPLTLGRPVVTFDSQYCPTTLARARLPIDCLVRLSRRRRLYRAPGPYRGRGRRPLHGAVFRTHDPTTQGPPDRVAVGHDARHGTVQVAVWEGLHPQGGHDAPFTVVRIQVERLPHKGTRPAPLWLAWVGGPLPADLLLLWRWYGQRFTVEHGFRFAKQDLGWTTVRLRDPDAADRWSWLVALAFWELWLARPLVVDQRLPWDRPLPPDRLTPGRVRRALPTLFAQIGTPARPPRPRGKAPGRRPGQCPGPQPRYPVVRRHPNTHRRRRKRAAEARVIRPGSQFPGIFPLPGGSALSNRQ
jgi:DDE superfamily endonuclease